MKQHYTSFIELRKSIAQEKDVNWNIPLSEHGCALDGLGWKLPELVGDFHSKGFLLRDFSYDAKALSVINESRALDGKAQTMPAMLSASWQDFIKAVTIEQLFSKRNTPSHVSGSVVRPLRVIATAVRCEPWELSPDDFRYTIEIARKIQPSQKLADLILGLVRVLFDAFHICDCGPIYGVLSTSRLQVKDVTAKRLMSKEQLRRNLEDRKRAARLPEQRAFWELVRIVMTEAPRSFVDELRFAASKLLIFTGLRIGETARLPLDYRRDRAYLDSNGRPAGESGGYSSAMMLRHYAEKQQNTESDSRILRQQLQPVPEMFRELIIETIERIAELTVPLRQTLRLQYETGRIFSGMDLNDLLPFPDFYVAVTGNPFCIVLDREKYVDKYRMSFDAKIFDEIWAAQLPFLDAGTGKFEMAMYQFHRRLAADMQTNKTSLRFVDKHGNVDSGSRLSWRSSYLKVGDLESHLRSLMPTKTSDTFSIASDSGPVHPWEFLFIHPKRSLAEERNGGLCDVTRYIGVGLMDSSTIGTALGDGGSETSLFSKYGKTEEDRALKLEAHSLRHLQTTELLRLGLADTIISKRFNRRSVAQTYEYDHRSLSEELEKMTLPDDIEILLGEKASTVAKLIKLNRASGPIVDAFLRIQAKDGDDAAYDFLRVEADGFHATPYGHCVNSFTVDPCPNHLECFNDCRHLSATGLPEQKKNLVILEKKFVIAVETIKAKPRSTTGWKNQIDHAESRLAGVRKILKTPPGLLVFPDGVDRSSTSDTILDK